MTNNNKRCYGCKFFDRYYTKEISRFCATKIGLCYEKGDCVNACDGCEKYQPKPHAGKSCFLLKHSLNGLLTELSELRKMLEAEHHEEV